MLEAHSPPPFPHHPPASGWKPLALPEVRDDSGQPLALYAERALAPIDPLATLERLIEEIEWQDEELVIFGKVRRVPRQVAFHGNDGLEYTYSRKVHEAHPWTPVLEEVRRLTEAVTGFPFNSVLCNLYRNGQDSMGWHSDDEPELGASPVIAAASFGSTRRLAFRAKDRSPGEGSIAHPLHAGSLILMAGRCQDLLQHSVPKTRAADGQSARVSLTFRYVFR